MQLRNSEFVGSDGVNIDLSKGCGNLRILGDIIGNAGQNPIDSNPVNSANLIFGGPDITVADGFIEQAAGIGLQLKGVFRASVSGMAFDDNGRTYGGAGIEINNSKLVSVSGSHFSGNGGTGANGAQINFAGLNDRISFSGNTYAPDQQPADATLKPNYTYDASTGSPGSTLTSSNLYETPAPQALGVYTTNAKKLLPQLQVPQIPRNFINGLGLVNGATGTAVTMYKGQASDSNNNNTIDLTTQCMLDLANAGPGVGLDAGSSLMNNTTYFFFAIASADGGNSTCIASMNPTPSFASTASTYAPYQTTVHGYIEADGVTVYSADTVAGVVAGDPVSLKISGTTYNTTIASVGTLTIPAPGATLTGDLVSIPPSPGLCRIANVTSTAGVLPGMTLSASGNYPIHTTIASVTSSPNTITVNVPSTFTCPGITGVSLVVSGSNVLTLNPAAGSPPAATAVTLTVYTGLYRMVGALYTNPSNTNIVPFTQDGDTFYLANSVTDINAASVSTGGAQYALSVPCGVPATCSPGVQVEALGRIAVTGSAANPVFLTSPDQGDQSPNPFPTAPGFSVKVAATQNSFPFRLFTSKSGKVRLRASTGSNTVNEVTDGWIFPRSLY